MTTMVGLYVEYKAKTQEIDAALSRLDKELKQVKNSQDQVSAGADKMKGKMTSAAKESSRGFSDLTKSIGFAALIAGFSQIAGSIDDLSKSAGTMGIAVAELQKLQYIGDLAGVSISELELSMRKLSKTIGDGMQGNKQAMEAFDKLGISLSSIQGQSVAQQYLQIATAIGNISDKNLQASISSDIFGRNYASVLKVIRQGVSETSAEFDSLGIAISDKAGAQVEAMNDAFTKLKTTILGVGQSLVITLAPVFSKLLSMVSTLIASIQYLDNLLKPGAFAGGPSIEKLAERAGRRGVNGVELEQTRITMEQSQSLLNNQLPSIIKSPQAAAVSAASDPTTKPFWLLGVETDKFTKVIEKLSKANNTLVESTLNTATKINQAADTMKKSIVDSGVSIASTMNKQFQELIKNNAFSQALSGGSETSSEISKIMSLVPKQPSPTNGTDFFSNVASDIISEINQGTDANGVFIQSSLRSLEKWVQQNSGAGYNVIGQKGALEEIKKFIYANGGLVPQAQKVDVNITVSPTKDFIVSVATSPENVQAAAKIVADVATQAARQLRGS